eukprot:3630115-Pyramimonas_sp.AAC.1
MRGHLLTPSKRRFAQPWQLPDNRGQAPSAAPAPAEEASAHAAVAPAAAPDDLFDEVLAPAGLPPSRQRPWGEARPRAPLPSRSDPQGPTAGAGSYDMTRGSRSCSGAGSSSDPPRVAGRRGREESGVARPPSPASSGSRLPDW